MAVGQPCILWLSGASSPGVHAIGHLVGVPVAGDQDGGQSTVEVSLRLLPSPVPRPELVLRAEFADAEVIRMPAGSNPSNLTAPQLAAVLELAERSLEGTRPAPPPSGACPSGDGAG